MVPVRELSYVELLRNTVYQTDIWGSSMDRESDVHDKQMHPNYFIWKE